MTPTEGQSSSAEPPKDNTAKIVGIVVGALVLIPVCCVLVAVMTIVILALLGPAIGSVFSGVIEGI